MTPKKTVCRDIMLSVCIAAVLFVPFSMVTQDPSRETQEQKNGELRLTQVLLSFAAKQAGSVGGNYSNQVGLDPNPVTRDGIILLTNYERKKYGLGPLNASPILNAIADKRLYDMQKNQYFSHDSTTGYGANDMASYFRYKYLVFGENIAFGDFHNNKDLMKAWMASQEHRDNILFRRFHEVGATAGLGVYQGRKSLIAIQVFGLPVKDCPPIDATLLDDITAEKVHELQLEHAADAVRKLLEQSRLNTDDAIRDYNEHVRIYKILSERIQYRIGVVNDLTNEYNKQVGAFNTCG